MNARWIPKLSASAPCRTGITAPPTIEHTNTPDPFPVSGPSPSYVDGPQWQALFGALNDLIGCGHMSGLLMRSICPLALMKSDDLDPYHHRSELFAHDGLRVI